MKAVLADLFTFARTQVTKSLHRLLPARRERLGLPPVRPSLLMPPNRLPTLEDVVSTDSVRMQYERCYVADTSAELLVHPTVTFDGVQRAVPYGSEVVVERYEGRFAFVTLSSGSGWILKDSLVSTVQDVLPQFTVGTSYASDHTETRKLRSYIEDAFAGSQARAPLSGVEYVTYKLKRKGQVVPWGTVRPRTAGLWQQLLKGVRGVHSGIVPKTGSVMEYNSDHGGEVSYVEAVSPEETIRVSMVSDDDESRYLELELSKESWRELRPIFIEIL